MRTCGLMLSFYSIRLEIVSKSKYLGNDLLQVHEKAITGKMKM